MNWVRRIEARGSRGDLYTVAISDTGAWGCSCPAWRFKKKDHTGVRQDCKHIVAVKAGLPRPQRPGAWRAPASPRLDVDTLPVTMASTLEIGARFRYLDIDMTVTL